MKVLSLALSLVLIVGCASQRTNIQNSVLLVRQQCEKDFLKVWGPPTRTFSSTTIPAPFVEWRSGSTTNQTEGYVLFNRGRRPLNVWEYANKGVTLWFDDEELIAWQWHDGSRPRGAQ